MNISVITKKVVAGVSMPVSIVVKPDERGATAWNQLAHNFVPMPVSYTHLTLPTTPYV